VPKNLATQEFFHTRIEKTIAPKNDFLREGSECRLLFGEKDLLPANVVDRYDKYLALQNLSCGADMIKSLITDILKGLIHPVGILERNDVKAPLWRRGGDFSPPLKNVF
jgi:23S rRNA (cytosine1962-C5)-methyltransferase